MTRAQLEAMIRVLTEKAKIMQDEAEKMVRKGQNAVANDLAGPAMVLWAHVAAYKAALEVTPE